MPSPAMVALLVVAAFFAGLVDAIAGGGGLIALPALLAAGLPPHVALGTNKGQAVFGATVVGDLVLATRDGRSRSRRARLRRWFRRLVPRRVGRAGRAAPSAARDRDRAPAVRRHGRAGAPECRAAAPHDGAARRAPPRSSGIALLLGAYDGFFGPGTGSMLVVAFAVVFGDTLTRASGNAKIVNLASNLAAMLLFAHRGVVVWGIALPMAAANALGAATGAHLAVRKGDRLVRAVVLVVVAAIAVKLAVDLARG